MIWNIIVFNNIHIANYIHTANKELNLPSCSILRHAVPLLQSTKVSDSIVSVPPQLGVKKELHTWHLRPNPETQIVKCTWHKHNGFSSLSPYTENI